MCDNIVALGPATADGSVIFGKNSDREPNEPHFVTLIPRAEHPKESLVHCTYIDIPQVSETNAVLLCKPTWLWGAEMGSNEHGLTIGNTAVFTREAYDTRPGLIGMDFLRLALERANSAPAALELITTLLEKHGQSGSNGFGHELYYHNSFLLADPNQAWILETIGSRWVAKRVREIGATSNTLTITTEWDLASADLIDYARGQGWANKGDFNVKESYGGAGFYTSYLYTVFGNGDERYQRLTGLLAGQKGQITEEVMMSVLRDHGPNAGENYDPTKGLTQNPPCMHVGAGPIRISQTTGSLVSHLATEAQTHWVTATAAP
jgi:dipeptidase